MFRIIVFGFVLFFLGCGAESSNKSQEDVTACTASVEPGIVVIIRDANTDKPLAQNAIVIITDGDYRETLRVRGFDGLDSSSANSVAGASERPGIYDINLTLDGYRGWSRTGMQVKSGICHVETVTLTARLEKL